MVNVNRTDGYLFSRYQSLAKIKFILIFLNCMLLLKAEKCMVSQRSILGTFWSVPYISRFTRAFVLTIVEKNIAPSGVHLVQRTAPVLNSTSQEKTGGGSHLAGTYSIPRNTTISPENMIFTCFRTSLGEKPCFRPEGFF